MQFLSDLGALGLLLIDQFKHFDREEEQIIGNLMVNGIESKEVQNELFNARNEKKNRIKRLKRDYYRAVKKYGVVNRI